MLPQAFSRPLWRLLPTLAALALIGCASDEFTFEADLPGDFSLVGNARYSPPESSHCNSPAKDDLTQHLFATSGRGERPYRVSYQVPLSLNSAGCKRELRHILIEIDGEPASYPLNAVPSDLSFASLTIRNRLAGSPGMPKKGARIFDGRCRWLLPDSHGGKRQLQCRASDIDGNWLAGRPGGELQRDELPGRIVRLAIGVAPDIAASAESRGTQALTADSSN
ncbi:hypothetical protein P3W53_17320 [Pseudomonas denitrificans (nom. rej.)]|nr:hypothetical protein [Pseudomonas denitrificans (nom. rej.)]